MHGCLKIPPIGAVLLVFGVVSLWSPVDTPIHTCIALGSDSETSTARFEGHVQLLYAGIRLKKRGLDFDVFRYALIGYYNLKRQGAITNRSIISIIDYRKSCNDKRFYAIDLIEKKVLYHTFAAHGRHSGETYAKHFSNEPGTLKSSLGFFVTGDTYEGEHGYSLYLYGMEQGINDKSRSRGIVLHGAYYARRSFIKRYGRLGRSQGCPALPAGPHIDIIDTIAGGICLFQFYDNSDYLQRSSLLDIEEAAAQFAEEYAPFVLIKIPDR